MAEAVSLRGVTKTFGPKVAVQDLDLLVPTGSLCGFIGPNGAGKTTTIRLIMSILFPDTGEVSVLGHRSALEAKDRIGYLPEERGVYRKMKAGAFLRYMGRLKGVDEKVLGSRVREWLHRLELADVEAKPCEELSKGMQQKLQFLAAIIHEPELLILDEPFSGLDPLNMRLLRELIRERHQAGATIMFSTHVMVQAEELCDHIIMINDSRKVLDESLAALRRRVNTRLLVLEPLEAAAEPECLEPVSEVETCERDGRVWRITLAESASPHDAIPKIVTAVPAARVELHRPSLEDIFVELVAGDVAAARGERGELRSSLREPGAAAGEVAQ